MTTTTTTTTTHKHTWQRTAHIDGCHYYTDAFACTGCKAAAQRTTERDPSNDPYNAVWMEPQLAEVRRDAHGRFITPRWEEKPCQRCDELQQGSPVHTSLTVIRADGTIEYEEHSQHEQHADDG